ncbi:lactosylceramide 1,3-N-acetyl-beta-D-glucosaminyltransferase B [Biomphalaria glabrata]|nr:lactosylceramide 1,3-N-acetyl-beta-D-glucosaminyltransferase B [Biomphalaria glabrata]
MRLFFCQGGKTILRLSSAFILVLMLCFVLELRNLSTVHSKLLHAYDFMEDIGEAKNVTERLRSSSFNSTLNVTVVKVENTNNDGVSRQMGECGENKSVDVSSTNMIDSRRNITLSPVAVDKVKSIASDLNVSKSEIIYPTNIIGEYVFVNSDLCRGVGVIDFIIIVHTAPDNLDRRQRIRQTFANESLFVPFHVRVAFLLGRPRNKSLENILFEEHQKYNDTVMGDFLDDYHNLTLKGVMGYRWVSQFCMNSRFVLKIDDDVMINTFKLLYSFYSHMIGKNKSIFCSHWRKNSMGILREGKWKVDSRIFPGKTTFPFDYCSGFVVIITTDLVAPMYEAAKVTPFFWIDDLYLFGMLPYVVGGVTFHDYPLSSNLTLNDVQAMKCIGQQGVKCPILASITRPDIFGEYWNLIKDTYQAGLWNLSSNFIV